jgi:hypothetical protein
MYIPLPDSLHLQAGVVAAATVRASIGGIANAFYHEKYARRSM